MKDESVVSILPPPKAGSFDDFLENHAHCHGRNKQETYPRKITTINAVKFKLNPKC